MPLIRELAATDCEVILAGSGASLQLLRSEFPNLQFAELPGYAVRYSSSSSQVCKIASQLPRLLKTCSLERRETEKIVARLGVDIIISDNRYGCRSSNTTNIFMGHQVNLILPSGMRRLSSLANRLQAAATARFDYWWVPDYDGQESLAGALSASSRPGLRYIGPLSRYGRIGKTTKKYDLAFLLSGPEPQRTLLERWVLEVTPTTALKIALVRGTTAELQGVPAPNLSVFDLLGSDGISGIIAASDIIIARSGYSTIMDLFHTGGRAVFVPTPGQTEQEYLARRMAELGYAGYVEQHRIDLAAVEQTASAYGGFPGREQDHSHLRCALDELLSI
jgi:UDP-N-acetylglucosamine transferase subunit ALG13